MCAGRWRECERLNSEGYCVNALSEIRCGGRLCRMRSFQVAYRRFVRHWDYNQPATSLMRGRTFLQKYPDARYVWMRVGLVLSDMARYAEAREALIRFINLRERDSPEHALPYVWMGDTFRRAGDHLGAGNWYRRAIAADPANCEGYSARGQLMLRRGRLSEAMSDLRKATECEGACDDAWHWRGIAHRTREEYFEAVESFNRALAIDSDMWKSREALADVRAVIRAAEWDLPCGLSHEEAYDRLRESRRDTTPAYNVLLEHEFLEQFPENCATWISLGAHLTDIHRYGEAHEALSRATDLRMEQCRCAWYGLPYQMGRLYQRMGDFPAADQWYRKGVIANPENAGPWIFRGSLHAVWGQFEIAKSMHRRGTQCEEGLPDEAWYNLGLILRAEEKFDKAANCFKRALTIDPDYAIAAKALRDVMAARAWQRQEVRTVE